MTYTTNEQARKSVEQFRRFDADTQLGLLWYGYLDIKDSLSPTTNQPSVTTPANAFFDQVRALPQKQQLQVQRDIVACADTEISHAYKALSSSAKLELWLKLAQGMENGTIIGVPADYELPSQTDNFVNTVKGWDFEQRVDFLRSAVDEMGAR
ncbi:MULTISPECIES: orange carotenoid protein N-terminal domain-containing protein [unclassified Anabaena]|uniref:orange carotenoid protein N-terminal domain-containing protein n=1 Tax=unclassified Anabaena TaxID=2619674 RepID=UPI00083555C8|nr:MULTISPECIES: orange carotenoid protein N-terminal domain-containing protein [unclassified Anabaena]